MDATALLSNMFPVFEPSSIADVLEVCDYDFGMQVGPGRSFYLAWH